MVCHRCIGSLCYITGNWIIQAFVFIIVTAVVLILLRPIAVKHINNKAEKTNVESIEGKIGKVISDIDNINAKGIVKIDGVEWTARSQQNEVIKAGTLVKVVSVEGVKVIVKETENK